MKRFFLLALFIATPAARIWAEDAANEPNMLNQRVDAERRWRHEGIVLIPHHFNYFLPYTYNETPNTSPNDTDLENVDKVEAKYQLSFKVLVWENVLNRSAYLYLAYTQLAMWQLYNKDHSSPFRDTNYEPELILTTDLLNMDFWGWKMDRVDYSLNHQSNGRAETLSRSWNRVIATAYLTNGPFGITIRPWYRIPESESHTDNPDIDHYMGHGELTLAYSYRRQLLTLMMRNNFNLNHNKGGYQVDYTFPLTRVLRGLVQYFYGYGECLLDYNHKNNRIGVGLALSEWR